MMAAVLWTGHISEGGQLVASEDKAVVEALCREMTSLLEDRGVEMTPLAALRVEDVLVGHLTVRALAAVLRRDGVTLELPVRTREKDPADSGSAPPPAKSLVVHPAVEALGKAQERLRKAMNELEETCARAGAPMAKGLGSRMKPILKQAEGVLEDALEYAEAERERKQVVAGCTGTKDAPETN